jgi:hypothetical protein
MRWVMDAAIVEEPNGVVAKLGGGSHRWSQEGPPRGRHRRPAKWGCECSLSREMITWIFGLMRANRCPERRG